MPVSSFQLEFSYEFNTLTKFELKVTKNSHRQTGPLCPEVWFW